MQRIISGIVMTAAAMLLKELYDKVQKKDVRYLRAFLTLVAVVGLIILGISRVVPEYMAEYFEQFAVIGLVGAVMLSLTVKSAIKKRLVIQLLERHRKLYHGLSYQYHQIDFKWRNTKKIYRVLNHTLQVCSDHLATKGTDIMISVKRDINNDIHILIGIRQLGRMLSSTEFAMMQAEIEEYRRLPKNIEIKVIVVE